MKGCRIGRRWGLKIVHLLWEVEKFLKLSNMPATKFGRSAVKDPRFVFDLRNGREPRPRTIQRVRAFLEAIS